MYKISTYILGIVLLAVILGNHFIAHPINEEEINKLDKATICSQITGTPAWVDSKGQVVSYWIGYNGQGRLPTLAWEPGDSIFDRLVLPLPNLPAGDYHLQVQMLSHSGPLAITREEEPASSTESQDTILSLTDISLDKPATLTLPKNINLVE